MVRTTLFSARAITGHSEGHRGALYRKSHRKPLFWNFVKFWSTPSSSLQRIMNELKFKAKWGSVRWAPLCDFHYPLRTSGQEP